MNYKFTNFYMLKINFQFLGDRSYPRGIAGMTFCPKPMRLWHVCLMWAPPMQMKYIYYNKIKLKKKQEKVVIT